MTATSRCNPVDTLKVRDAKDVEQVVRAAIASEQPLEIIGHGSKRQIGQPMATNALLDLSDLNAVSAYEPNELIITVQAGAPLADVQSLIDSKNQQFAFEPIDTSALTGVPDIGTIGGMIGVGLAGPRRIRAGGARDHLLGAHAVSGFGDSFKTGGRVVKNVTGYDLCKLLAGSWGTLAVMTEVTLKLMPKPEIERTLMLAGRDDVELHFERFAAPPVVDGTEFSVSVASSGAAVRVGADETLLGALKRDGVHAPYSCQQGFCGTCRVRVLGGDVEHRDTLLTDPERDAGMMLVCVSRAAGDAELILDL
jgi:glycolate oxidase FAD binding subunit